MEVKVYTTPTCPWCKKTKNLLEEHDIDYQEFDVSEDEEAAREMVEESGQRGVPVTIIDDEVIIGYDRNRLEQALQ